jgi:hypothetical protein
MEAAFVTGPGPLSLINCRTTLARDTENHGDTPLFAPTVPELVRLFERWGADQICGESNLNALNGNQNDGSTLVRLALTSGLRR